MSELSQCDLGNDAVGPATIDAPNLAAAQRPVELVRTYCAGL